MMNQLPPAPPHPLAKSQSNRNEAKYSIELTELCLEKLPLCCPFILLHSRWEKDTYYNHIHQSMTTIEIILEGMMYYEVNGKSFQLHANQMILLPVGCSNRIRNASRRPARKIVIGVHGSLCEVILAHYQLFGGKIYSLKDPLPIIRHLGEFSSLYDAETISEHLSEITGKSFELLYLLKEQLENSNPMENLLQMIQVNFQHYISIDEFARKNGISRQRLSFLFKNVCGMSPMKYLIWQRMEIAKQLLGETTLSIKNIAERVGYSSAVRFSHAFKHEVGLSPRDFRRSTQTDPL